MNGNELIRTLTQWVASNSPNAPQGVSTWLDMVSTLVHTSNLRNATDWEFARDSVYDDSGDFAVDADGGTVYAVLIKSNYSTRGTLTLIVDSTSSVTFDSDDLDILDRENIFINVPAATDSLEANSQYGSFIDPLGVVMTDGINIVVDSVTSADTAPVAGEHDAIVVYRSGTETRV